MKIERFIGIICISIALGMLFMFFVQMEFIAILIIAAVILVCGLGFSNGLTFTIAGTSITLTALAIAAIAGIVLYEFTDIFCLEYY